MGHERYVKDSVIHSTSGGILHVGVEEGNNKYYAVITQCGHVGRGFFIPICFGICAKNMESAIELAKSTARVKRDAKYCILGASEISHAEFLLIEYANDRDPYLRTDYVNQTFEEIESRRIITEELVEDIIAETPANARSEKKENKLPSITKIKTADEYEDYQVLQRYFAPVKYGNKYIFSRRINMDELLAAYYQEIAIKFGILKKKPSPLAFYYQIFGRDNSLGLSYDESSGCLLYRSLNGNMVHVPLSDSSKTYVEGKVASEGEVFAQKQKLEDVKYVPTSSAIEKFNRRLAKHQQLTQKQPKQPGSDEE